MRHAGKTAGLLAFLLDAAKGALAALLVQRFEDPASPLVPAAAAMAVLGHMYPVWLGFRGGKGVATGAGAFLPLAPYATLAALLAFALALALTRYVSVASIVGASSLAVAVLISPGSPALRMSAMPLAVFIVWKHRANLRRLAAGTENRLGSRRA